MFTNIWTINLVREHEQNNENVSKGLLHENVAKKSFLCNKSEYSYVSFCRQHSNISVDFILQFALWLHAKYFWYSLRFSTIELSFVES